MRKIAIISAKRTPNGKIPGELSYLSEIKFLSDMLTYICKDLNYMKLDEALLGCSFPTERDNLCRKAILQAGLPCEVQATTISKTCASSDEALNIAYDRILCGKANSILVSGAEKVSNSSYILHYMKNNIKRAFKQQLPLFKDIENDIAENNMAYINEKLSRQYYISRKEQDEFVIRSIQKAKEANQSGNLKNEIVSINYFADNLPYKLDTDELLMIDRSKKEIDTAPPIFLQDGCITQYNAAPMSDCCAVIVLMELKEAYHQGLNPKIIIKDTRSVGVPQAQTGLAMVKCIEHILRENKLTKEDIDLYEINESFAAQTLCVMKLLQIDEERVNVNGGNLALGYPIGATGLRMGVTLVNEMMRRENVHLGLSVICAGGNMAHAVIYERIV